MIDVEVQMSDGELFYGSTDCKLSHAPAAVELLLDWHRKQDRVPTGYRLARDGEWGPWVALEVTT